MTTNAPPSFMRRHSRKFLLVAIIISLIAGTSFLFVFIAFEVLHERERRLSGGLHERDSRLSEGGVSHLSQSFDSASWKTSLTSDSFEPIRLRMVDDLLHRHRLRGMTREEVVSLLGTPPEPNYFRDYDLAYWLGSERGDFSLDSEWWLAIRPFDRRIVAQGAVFTYHHDVRGPLKCEKVREEYKGAAPEGVNLVRIRVTAGGKRHLQRQLSDLGISRKTLFPDLEGLSAFLNWRTKRGMWTREQLAGRQEMAFPA